MTEQTPLERAVYALVQHNLTEPLMESPLWDAWATKQRELIQAVWVARLEESFPGKVGADF